MSQVQDYERQRPRIDAYLRALKALAPGQWAEVLRRHDEYTAREYQRIINANADGQLRQRRVNSLDRETALASEIHRYARVAARCSSCRTTSSPRGKARDHRRTAGSSRLPGNSTRQGGQRTTIARAMHRVSSARCRSVTGEALALGSFTDEAALFASEANACTIIRAVSVDDTVRFEEAVRSMPDASFGPIELMWSVRATPLRLFDSASSRAARLKGDYLGFALEPGRYAVLTMRYDEPYIAEAVVHRIVRLGDVTGRALVP